ncbi:unnamed protein product [Dibothriocephalus latus]|uniref:Carbohydrate kinase FGGY C-terminal domain-containing protein n=1 Tax=Dibothriocephalus latus TaxID=60516 RepID=A0A3P7LUA3_DIBLA|nr:unnamed protein product [Dibothriocephalus latus]
MTALGAAVAAAISVGIDPTHLLAIRTHEPSGQDANTFTPRVDEKTRELWLDGWKRAVERSLGWAKKD